MIPSFSFFFNLGFKSIDLQTTGIHIYMDSQNPKPVLLGSLSLNLNNNKKYLNKTGLGIFSEALRKTNL